MKIEFSRAGGFAAPAMRQNLEIDTDDLPQHEAKELLELVSNAEIKTAVPAAPPNPDAFHYRIKVSDGDVSHTATASDADMPAALNSLVEWLSNRASGKS